MALQSQGYTLVICSNGKQEYIETVASVCDIPRHFAAARGKKIPLTKSERFKELLKEFTPSFAVFVGDRVHDFDAARENSVMSIGVTFVTVATSWREPITEQAAQRKSSTS